MEVVVVGRGEKKMMNETQFLDATRHARGASDSV